MSGQAMRPLASQKGMARRAIAPFSALEIVRERKSLIAAAIISAARSAIRPRAVGLCPTAFPVARMAYQSVTMLTAATRLAFPARADMRLGMSDVPTHATDILIVGAGIAGASLAAALAPHRQIVMIEAEDRPGVHATGRSAAFWHESYGGVGIQPLSAASYAALAHPPADLSDRPLLTPRAALTIG